MGQMPPSRWQTAPARLRESLSKPTCWSAQQREEAEEAAEEAEVVAAVEVEVEVEVEVAGLLCVVERLQSRNPTHDPTLLKVDADQAVNSTYWK